MKLDTRMRLVDPGQGTPFQENSIMNFNTGQGCQFLALYSSKDNLRFLRICAVTDQTGETGW